MECAPEQPARESSDAFKLVEEKVSNQRYGERLRDNSWLEQPTLMSSDQISKERGKFFCYTGPT